MAGQRAGAPAGEALGHPDVPVPRQSPDGPRGDRRRGTPERAQERRAPGRGQARRSPGSSQSQQSRGTAALLALGLPLAGALLDELISSKPGLIFAVLTVLGTAGAALVSSRAGWWWVLPAPPPVVLAFTAATELVANPSKYQSGKALATGAAGWAIHGFPVMASAIGAALVVVLVRIARDRGSRRG